MHRRLPRDRVDEAVPARPKLDSFQKIARANAGSMLGSGSFEDAGPLQIGAVEKEAQIYIQHPGSGAGVLKRTGHGATRAKRRASPIVGYRHKLVVPASS